MLDWTTRGFEHPEERVRPLADGRFEVESTTHGDADELELRLHRLLEAQVAIEVRVTGFDGSLFGEPASFAVPAAALLDTGRVHFDLGGEGLFVAVERVTGEPLPLALKGELMAPLRAGPCGAYPLYLFARELGDAKVWTSPLFVVGTDADQRVQPLLG